MLIRVRQAQNISSLPYERAAKFLPLLAAAIGLFMPIAFAEVKLPPVFADKMVLQRELPVPVWGSAAPGENVTVSFDGQKLTALADDSGKWMVKLAPLQTSRTGKEMTIQGAANSINLKDVLVGEVWLCSGQSNMADSFNKNKGHQIDPQVFDSDLSTFRFYTPGYNQPGTGK